MKTTPTDDAVSLIQRGARPNLVRNGCTVVLLVLAVTGPAVELPLGHPDFLSSPTQPIGWRGDGTGRYLGATAPVRWDESTGENVWMIRK